MGRQYSKIENGILDRLLTHFKTAIPQTQEKYSLERQSKEQSASFRYTEKQVNALREIITEVHDVLLPRFDKGKTIGFSDYYSLLKSKEKLGIFVPLFYTPDFLFYKILKENLPSIFKKALDATKEKKLTASNQVEVRTQLKTIIRARQGSFNAVMEIPGGSLDAAFLLFDEVIDNVELISQKTAVKDLLVSFETKHLDTVFKKYEIKINHPMMFELVMELLPLLKELPSALPDLVPFLNPDINIPTKVSYIKPENAANLSECYIYTHGDKQYDAFDLYARFLPQAHDFILSYIRDYFDTYTETTHVKSERAKTDLIKAYIRQETQPLNDKIEELKNTFSPIESESIDGSLVGVVRAKLLNERIKLYGLIKHDMSTLLDEISIKRAEFLKNKNENFSALIAGSKPLNAQLQAYVEAGLDTSFASRCFGNLMIVSENPLMVKPVLEFAEDYFTALRDSLLQLSEEVKAKENECVSEIIEIFNPLREEVLQKHHEKNQQFETGLSQLLSSCNELSAEEAGEDDPEKLLQLLENRKERNAQLQAQFEQLQSDFHQSTTNLKLPEYLPEYYAKLHDDALACFHPSEALLISIGAKIHSTAEKLQQDEEKLYEAISVKNTDVADFRQLLVEKEAQLKQLQDEIGDRTSARVGEEIQIHQKSLDENAGRQIAMDDYITNWNNLYKEAFALVACVEPNYENNVPELKDIADSHVFLEHLDKIVNEFDSNLKDENLQILLQVKKCKDEHAIKDEIPFDKIAALPALKNTVGSENAVRYVCQLLEENPDDWVTFQKNQSRILRSKVDEAIAMVSTFDVLLLTKTETAEANPDFTLNKQCAEYRKIQNIIARKRTALAALSTEIPELVQNQDELLIASESLKRELTQLVKQEQEITQFQDEVLTLEVIIDLLDSSQKLNTDIAEFVAAIQSLDSNDLLDEYMTCEEAIRLMTVNYDNQASKLANYLDAQYYQSKISAIQSMQRTTESRLKNCVQTYDTKLSAAIMADGTLLEEKGLALQALTKEVNISLESSLGILSAYNDLLFERNRIVEKHNKAGCGDLSSKKLASIFSKTNELLEIIHVNLMERIAGSCEQFSEAINASKERINDSRDKKEILQNERAFVNSVPADLFENYKAKLSQLQPESKPILALIERVEREHLVLQNEIRKQARLLLCNSYKAELDKYLTDRDKKYAIKDRVTGADQLNRHRFITQFKEHLYAFQENEDFDILKESLKIKFPGKKLQPLINRLVLEVKNYEKDYPSIPIVQADTIKVLLLELNKTNPELVNQITTLINSIEIMQQHGESLSEKDRDSGQTAVDLATQLKKRLFYFLNTNQETLSQPQDAAYSVHLNGFKEEFSLHLHSQDDKLSKHRALWKPIMMNILAAIGTLGVAVGIKLLISKFGKEGRATFFYDNTDRMNHVEKVDEALQKMATPIS
jgi:hypothetical protein